MEVISTFAYQTDTHMSQVALSRYACRGMGSGVHVCIYVRVSACGDFA